MSISDIFYECRADNIKNFIPATQIKTQEDIDEYNAKGYAIGYTADEFAKTFPDKVFYNNGFNKTYYYDASQFILFVIHMYGRQVLSFDNNFQEEILKTILGWNIQKRWS